MPDARTPSATFLPPFLLLVLGINWGFGFVLSKIGVTGGLLPLGYSVWQASGAGLMLLAITCWRRAPPPLTLRHVRYYVIAGVTNIAIPSTIALVCVQHIPVGVVVLIVTLSPLMTYALSQIVGIEKFNPRRALGMVLGFVGALLILVPRTSLPTPDMAWWALVGVLIPIFYAGSNVYIGWARPTDVPSLALGAAMQLCSGLAVLPVALIVGHAHMLWPPFTSGELANLSHIVFAGIGALLFFEIIRMAGPVYMSQVAYIVCLSGVLWGWLLFDERHSVWIWAAMALIIAGLALVTAPGRRPKRVPG
jgi:drug/metabolite transporter (DMT)-like permease